VYSVASEVDHDVEPDLVSLSKVLSSSFLDEKNMIGKKNITKGD